jgi:hypothetical protein
MGLTADQVARLVNFQQAQGGPLPMIPHGHPDPNTLINMGQYDPLESWPSSQRDFIQNGEKPGTFFRDMRTVNNQVPQWAWLVLAGTFSLLAYLSYRNHRKQQKRRR